MSQQYLTELTQSLNKLKPYKAILFGSYAEGTIHEDSDIDLIIVLNKDSISTSFGERMSNYSYVKNYLRALNKKVPIDLIVYTKAEWFKLLESNNSFCKEILQKGVSLI